MIAATSAQAASMEFLLPSIIPGPPWDADLQKSRFERPDTDCCSSAIAADDECKTLKTT
jgi:hypothetical protein